MGKLGTVEWISIIDITTFIAGTVVGWYIHRRITNGRLQKEHLAKEIKNIQKEYAATLNDLFTDSFRPQTALIWFRLINIQVRNIMKQLKEDYGIDADKLSPYQQDLRELITNSPEFNTQYTAIGMLKISERLRGELLSFQSAHSHLFNEIIRDINKH